MELIIFMLGFLSLIISVAILVFSLMYFLSPALRKEIIDDFKRGSGK